ncbi:MAG: hypothetical protein WCI11_10185 [Candidatus Methylumidiphilus sp.]
MHRVCRENLINDANALKTRNFGIRAGTTVNKPAFPPLVGGARAEEVET